MMTTAARREWRDLVDMRKAIYILAAILMFSCAKTQPTAAPSDEVRKPIDTLYVGVPRLSVYAQPNDAAPVVTTYGYTESVSILARQGPWSETRTYDGGSAWVHSAELITATQVEEVLANPAPRFALAPQQIPSARVHGVILLQARVNADGEVVDVQPSSNTTGRDDLVEANADALRRARFFPLIDKKGQRASFTYEYSVTY
jgi:outer membrane biosynthesis protein TonB